MLQRRQLHTVGQFAHHRHRADDLVDGFALHPHAHQEGADLRVGALPGHDLAHDRLHFLGGQVELVDDAIEGSLDIHLSCPPHAHRPAGGGSQDHGHCLKAIYG